MVVFVMCFLSRGGEAIRENDLVVIFDRIPIPKRYFDNWREAAAWRMARNAGNPGPEILG